MRSLKALLFVGTILGAIALGADPVITQNVRAAAFTVGLPCTITMADRLDDAIVSDGQGPYIDGVNGIECTVYQGSSDDVTFNFTAAGKKAVRYLQFDYTDKVSGTGPTGTLSDHSVMSSIQGIASIGVGSTVWSTGGFTTGIGRFAFNPTNWPGASLLSVTRTSAEDWVVTADAGVNEIAVLSQSGKKGSVDVGHYRMPFQLAIHCASCQ